VKLGLPCDDHDDDDDHHHHLHARGVLERAAGAEAVVIELADLEAYDASLASPFRSSQT
jgi:hypothetical protein